MRRFFIQGLLANTMVITGDDARHISVVLRLAVGDQIIVVDREGKACQARITQSSADAVHVVYVADVREQKEPPIEVWLAQGLPKSDKMDFIVQKAVELGVSRIVPLVTAHCVVKYDAAKQKARQERWQKIAQEAAKQCGRTIIPEVTAFQSLPELLTASHHMAVIMLYEGGTPGGLKSILRRHPHSSYLLIVGPEGGFNSQEVELCRRRGAQIVTLGPRILRTETAGLAAVSALMYEHGDLGEIPGSEGEICRE